NRSAQSGLADSPSAVAASAGTRNRRRKALGFFIFRHGRRFFSENVSHPWGSETKSAPRKKEKQEIDGTRPGRPWPGQNDKALVKSCNMRNDDRRRRAQRLIDNTIALGQT